MKDSELQPSRWTLPQKIFFRFFFIYFLLFISPWSWFSIIPGFDYLMEFYFKFLDWAVISGNEKIFHVFGKKHIEYVSNGSGDTSYGWALQWLLLSVSAIGAIIWSVIQYNAKSYRQLNYLLCLVVRYSLVLEAFGYGISKIFALQMPFPWNSQLATPLGDLLPMRLSWLFIGYSTPYQMFSGIMEVLVALLLLYRRTATLGVLIATAVFINVMMLNLCYDIPVKLFAMNLVLQCLYLVANETKQLTSFFILRKPVPEANIYHYPLRKKWMKITRIVLKLGIFFILAQGMYNNFKRYNLQKKHVANEPFTSGVYDVIKYVVNKDTIPPLITDSLRWQDVIIDEGENGSIKTSDTSFRRRYGRALFFYTADTAKSILYFHKNPKDSFGFIYKMPDSNTILLTGTYQKDSLYVELKKSNRHFQLAEKQFHWLSEANR